jgi:hypothetical protein
MPIRRPHLLRRALGPIAAALVAFPAAAAADTGPYLDAASWPRTASYSCSPSTPPASPRRAWTPCVHNPVTITEYGHRIRRHGHVACERARHVLSRDLRRRRIESPRWRCGGRAVVTCRRQGDDWVRVRRFALPY